MFSFPGALGGLFSQIASEDDIVRERAIKFMSTKMKTLPEEIFTKEVEDVLITESKKVRTQIELKKKTTNVKMGSFVSFLRKRQYNI